MNDGDFEWNDRKASENYSKHGVTFELARFVFRDAFAIENFDGRESHGEARYTVIGMVESRLLLVAYTMRGGTIPYYHGARSRTT